MGGRGPRPKAAQRALKSRLKSQDLNPQQPVMAEGFARNRIRCAGEGAFSACADGQERRDDARARTPLGKPPTQTRRPGQQRDATNKDKAQVPNLDA